ncbi:SDR family NAD(P)-dependent oxidoreductase [Sphingobium sp. Sx8-8]|uniref:SDR family NAD(P)-dependent oxidoreductase n=1 Tax=Sphingobium sp. Sx8-8 TaxID=2933617 RepID=UPI001F5AB0D9|nr:SDR family NAD(P)-dependent oxidoreductase [Sphingobium sp. Sx8-8]
MAELRLDGKVALITGSGRGLGRAYAHLLASRGAKIVVNDPGVSLSGEGGDRQPALDVVSEIEEMGGVATANFDSVATTAGAQAMIAQALDEFGGIDIVVNNAGNFLPKHSFIDSSEEAFASIWQVHVMGSINVIRAAWPHMCRQGSGRIVNTCSHVGYLGNDGLIEYATAKAAIHGLTRTLAAEATAFGIAVNAVAPAGMTRPNAADPAIAERFAEDGSFHVDLVSPTVLWLAHQDCDVSGEIFGVMAGTTTRIIVAETKGYTSRTPTPEAIRDHFDTILGRETVAGSGLDTGTSGEGRGMALITRYDAV